MGSAMKQFSVVFLAMGMAAYCFAVSPTPAQPYIGEWNFTSPAAPDAGLCMKLRAAVRLNIIYDTHNGTKLASIMSDRHVIVDDASSQCDNSSSDINQTLALKFNDERTLTFYFTRDSHITGDEHAIRWQLYKVAFNFTYDNATFPDSLELDQADLVTNTNSTLSGIATSFERSFSCSRTGLIEVTKHFKISFTDFRVQAFMTKDDFAFADHCAADQENIDLIPICIGAALAALVVIVLIAYLIGRARAAPPSYDNMK